MFKDSEFGTDLKEAKTPEQVVEILHTYAMCNGFIPRWAIEAAIQRAYVLGQKV